MRHFSNVVSPPDFRSLNMFGKIDIEKIQIRSCFRNSVRKFSKKTGNNISSQKLLICCLKLRGASVAMETIKTI